MTFSTLTPILPFILDCNLVLPFSDIVIDYPFFSKNILGIAMLI